MPSCGGPAPPGAPGSGPSGLGQPGLWSSAGGRSDAEAVDGWLYYVLRLPHGRNPLTDQYREAVRLRRALEGWLLAHHVGRPLLDRGGRPLSELVSVVFRQDQAERVLAFRMFCNSLGVAEAMDHFRVVPTRCRRTTPPAPPTDALPPLFRPPPFQPPSYRSSPQRSPQIRPPQVGSLQIGPGTGRAVPGGDRGGEG